LSAARDLSPRVSQIGADIRKDQLLSNATLVRQLLQIVFESSPIGIGVCDASLRITSVNNAWAAMDGIPSEAHKGKTVRDVLGVAACPVEQAMARVLSTGIAIYGLEVTAKVPARSAVGRWLVNLIPLKNCTGTTTHVGSVTVETTPRTGFQSFMVAHGHAVPLLAPEPPRTATDRSTKGHLSPRETEVTRFLALGKTNKEIASLLNISVRTVDTHRRRVMDRLNFHSVAELGVYAAKNGIIGG
jgi:DNA-binding CsgD family transcriptional regulator